ncbi:hypothetical protein FN846DRAFT_988950 [Sphaerosporella brunnea]|uniref:Uncharacterized protein n=1 Tax=Sphaerosporella brunnea TaxID=1250544 RepID=A0A5J5ER19_9PEZI|nr:hypothetical protein FN846DRAFT_988950 [Sphaerosporella brunnea]
MASIHNAGCSQLRISLVQRASSSSNLNTMGRPNKRKLQSRQAGAISASRTRKRSRLDDAESLGGSESLGGGESLGNGEPEPYQIPGARREVSEEDPEEELGRGAGERGEEDEEEEEEEEEAESGEGESGGERENEYLENLIADLSVPPNPEGSAEPEIPTVRDQDWPRLRNTGIADMNKLLASKRRQPSGYWGHGPGADGQ